MGLLSRQMSSRDAQVCSHEVLDARWDSMSDVGHAECVDDYVCRSCDTRVVASDREPEGEAA